MTLRISWREASARRLERQFLANSPAGCPRPPANVVRALVRRYLTAYGPATPTHFAKWLATKEGWAPGLFGELAAQGAVEEVLLEGARAWVAAGDTEFPDAADPEAAGGAGGVPGGRLLPYFNAYVIAAQPREPLFPGCGRAVGRVSRSVCGPL
ncbi:DNA glycosylase AlkZ-like family protein [Streptomyces sp. ME18-1-4]|uniref:DNA glycosylase AlkZ-like family protein n=1 Tax=Streptomyces sp. ME18-1-4 TaxID=3028685 RepID=UPI0039F72C91